MIGLPRILIVTAAFGEGHNSAARNLALALEAMGCVTHVADPCSLGAPQLTERVCKAYRLATNHLPRVWAAIYRSTDRFDFNRPRAPLMGPPEKALAALVIDFRPDAVVSTFPLYPYFLPRIFEKSGKKLPIFTVITDSIEINASWLRCPTDFWLVTDRYSREKMIGKHLPAEKIVETGFPVNPVFDRLQPLGSDAECDPFRVLYFPTAKRALIGSQCRAMLDASPAVKLTLVLGRNVRLLASRAKEIQKAYPGRVRLVGWTRRVPQFLSTHHLVVGKAGGATVHEAIAATCPMLIHHLVPGQEEGNLRLLETIGGGRLAETPEALRSAILEMTGQQAKLWRSMKQALVDHGKKSGAITAAKFILDHL
jgi:processive 1,2-diacylglycerol beta-glucosyltransferase